MIYTSGSTGKPKGVGVQHCNLTASTRARSHYYGSPHSILLVPSIAFDSSVATLFWALCEGGTLVVPEAGLERDPQHLAQLVTQHQVHAWLGVPSLYDTALAEAGEQLASLQIVILAGEALPPAVAERSLQRQPNLRGLFNEYGPTEATVWSCVAQNRSGGPQPADRPSHRQHSGLHPG